jgi:transcriptional regulator with XRE-family HTH domain
MVRFGQHVAALRRAQGMSQESLALDSGLARSYMGGVERGDSNVTLLKMHVIAQALDLSLAELMRKAKL